MMWIDVDYLAQDREQWRAHVNRAVNLRIS